MKLAALLFIAVGIGAIADTTASSTQPKEALIPFIDMQKSMRAAYNCGAIDLADSMLEPVRDDESEDRKSARAKIAKRSKDNDCDRVHVVLGISGNK